MRKYQQFTWWCVAWEMRTMGDVIHPPLAAIAAVTSLSVSPSHLSHNRNMLLAHKLTLYEWVSLEYFDLQKLWCLGFHYIFNAIVANAPPLLKLIIYSGGYWVYRVWEACGGSPGSEIRSVEPVYRYYYSTWEGSMTKVGGNRKTHVYRSK